MPSGHRGTYGDATKCKDWPWRKVVIKMRGRSDEQILKLVQWAFDNYFYMEAKEIHFGHFAKVPVEIEDTE